MSASAASLNDYLFSVLQVTFEDFQTLFTLQRDEVKQQLGREQESTDSAAYVTALGPSPDASPCKSRQYILRQNLINFPEKFLLTDPQCPLGRDQD